MWSEWRDSNSQQLEPKSSRLPIGVHPDILSFNLAIVTLGSQPNAPLLILSHSLLVKLKDYTICHILLRRKHLNVTQVISHLWSLALPFMYWYYNPRSWEMVVHT